MIKACRKCGGAPRPVKVGDGFSIVCSNKKCEASMSPTKPFFTLMFAYAYWGRQQSIASDFEINDLTERKE